MSSTFPDIGELLPHTGAARLLTRVVAFGEQVIDAVGIIPEHHPLVSEGHAPAFLAIELGAQAAAAMETLHKRNASGCDEQSQVGALVRVRVAELARVSFPADTPVCVKAKLDGQAQALSIYRISTAIDDMVFCEAVITTLVGSIRVKE